MEKKKIPSKKFIIRSIKESADVFINLSPDKLENINKSELWTLDNLMLDIINQIDEEE